MSEEDAREFLIDIIRTEYSQYEADNLRLNGFKRTFAQTNSDIDIRIKKMHRDSPTEYSWGGLDKNQSLYIFWGLTSQNLANG
jgi:hypothetical protein